jgi:hypothetical protein
MDPPSRGHPTRELMMFDPIMHDLEEMSMADDHWIGQVIDEVNNIAVRTHSYRVVKRFTPCITYITRP